MKIKYFYQGKEIYTGEVKTKDEIDGLIPDIAKGQGVPDDMISWKIVDEGMDKNVGGKFYLIDIQYLHPYPVNHSYRVRGGSFGVAIRRGINMWRKECGKGIKVRTLSIKATKI